VTVHGVWLEPFALNDLPQAWSDAGIPAQVIERAVDYHTRWGGLALPPAPGYDGGPRFLQSDTPEQSPTAPDWHFDAGSSRTAVPYSFMIGPDGSFGIRFDRWVRLHSGIEGWIESLALTYAVRDVATRTTKVIGDAVDTLDLTSLEAVPEVCGVTDTWWLGPDSAIAIYRGEAELFQRPDYRAAYVYSGFRRRQWA